MNDQMDLGFWVFLGGFFLQKLQNNLDIFHPVSSNMFRSQLSIHLLLIS